MLSVGVLPSSRFGRAREVRGCFVPARERLSDPTGTDCSIRPSPGRSRRPG